MTKTAKFGFEGFKIKKSIFNLNTDNQGELDLNIDLSGRVNLPAGTFELTMDINIKNDDDTLDIQISAIGNYSFEPGQNFDDLKNFLLVNSPALLFPYVRAYIATLTNLSGIRSITLPTLNLLDLRESLENALIIEE